MHTSVRRSLPVALAVSGALLAVTGVPPADARHLVPGVVLLLLAGGTAGLSLHLWRARRATRGLRRAAASAAVAPPVAVAPWAPLVPTQRTPRPAAPPRPAPPHLSGAKDESGPGDGWSDARPPGDPPRAGLRHRVLPHGALPRQRRAPEGS